MAQNPPGFCLRCGAPIVQGQRFCARCGLPVDTMQRRGNSVLAPQNSIQRPNSASNQPAYSRPASSSQDIIQTSRQAQRRRGPGRTGTRLVILLLLLLVVLGVASYFGLGLLGISIPGIGSGLNGQSAVTTQSINEAVPYAGVTITILNVQQAQSFGDDPNTSTDGMVRLNLQEQNKTSGVVSWQYYDIARLVLPGKTIVSPKYVKAKVGIAPGATQTSFIDFAVPVSIKINSLILRLGASSEEQMDIPLTGRADLSKYQPKTTQLDGQMQYLGLNWTLTSVTSSLSVVGQQAPKGMRYFTVTLKVDNTLSQIAIIGSAYDYMRLKSGNTTASPEASTLPVSFATGVMGKTGTVTFLLPQGSTAFTLILLPQNQSGVDQTSTDFQLA